MRLILASTSPRRALLLREAGYHFEQVAPTWTDPPKPPAGNGEQVAMETARRKALSVPREMIEGRPDALVIAADTVIVNPPGSLAPGSPAPGSLAPGSPAPGSLTPGSLTPGSLTGTPATLAEARTMIRSFVNADHDVVTGVALCLPAPGTCFADRATVRVGYVSHEAIETYLATDAWRDKAGGYNLFERREAGWPIEVIGDPTTVVGLPIKRLSAMLSALGA